VVNAHRGQAADPAQVLRATVSTAQVAAPVASGVLLSTAGGRGVFVSYQGEAYQFKTLAQLARDGYGGTAAVPVPGPDDVAVVFPYSGS
jgi:hypothetical protein